MDTKDYVIAFLVSLCVSLTIMLSGFDFSTLQWSWPVIPEQTQIIVVGGFCAIAIPVLSIILAYRLKHTDIKEVSK